MTTRSPSRSGGAATRRARSPGTGLGRQVGSVEGQPGHGWSLASTVGADRAFAALAGLVVLVGLTVWLLTTVLG